MAAIGLGVGFAAGLLTARQVPIAHLPHVPTPVRAVVPEPTVPSPDPAVSGSGAVPDAPGPVSTTAAQVPEPVMPSTPTGAEAAARRTVAPPAAGEGMIFVASRPGGARVILDGRVVGETPLGLRNVRAGVHDLRLELPGFRPWTTSITVSADAWTRIGASLEQTDAGP